MAQNYLDKKIARDYLRDKLGVDDIAKLRRVSIQRIRRAVMLHGGKMRKPGRPQNQLDRVSGKKIRGLRDVARAERMKQMYLNEGTLQSIADEYKISRERVRQILRAYGVPVLSFTARGIGKKIGQEITPLEAKMARLYEDGWGPRAICKKLNVECKNPNEVLKKIREKCGLVAHRGPMPYPDRDEKVKEVCDLYSSGLGGSEICRRLDYIGHPETVYHYLKLGGVTPRYERGRRWKNHSKKN
jgi:hypothetical protein